MQNLHTSKLVWGWRGTRYIISKPFLERVTAPWMEVHHCIQVFTGLKINDGDMIEYVRTCVLQLFFSLVFTYIYLFARH